MMDNKLFKTLPVVAMFIALGGGCLAVAPSAQAQLVPTVPKEQPVPDERPNVSTAPKAAPGQPIAAPHVVPTPAAPTAIKPGGAHNLKAQPTPPATWVERKMHQLDDFLGRSGKALEPTLPALLIGIRMGLMLLVLIGYVVFHFQRQKRQALEAEQKRRLSEAETEFGRDADWRSPSSEEDRS